MDGIFAGDSREQSRQQLVIQLQIIIDEFSNFYTSFYLTCLIMHRWHAMVSFPK